MRGFAEHLISFPSTSFNKFNNTRARMQNFIYHNIISHLITERCLHQNVTISPLVNATFLWTSTYNVTK